jgi:hypothetical protein
MDSLDSDTRRLARHLTVELPAHSSLLLDLDARNWRAEQPIRPAARPPSAVSIPPMSSTILARADG